MKYKKKLLIALVSIFLCLAAYFGMQYVIHYYLPGDIKLLVNEKQDFGFDLPLNAELNGNLQGVLKFNNQDILTDNFTLNLGTPFSLESNKTGEIDVQLKLFGLIPVKTVKIDVIPEKQIAPAGLTVGVTVYTDGILILGTGYVFAEDGMKYNPAKGKLYTGDYIKKVNHKPIDNKEQLIKLVNNSKGQPIHLEVIRNQEKCDISIVPVKTIQNNEYKIGVWVRDDTQGIGTVTYINFENETFGALGHGITDIDTKQLMEIREGQIVETMITTIKKGVNGAPGEISGIIVNDDENHLGEIKHNSLNGIFGKIHNNIKDIVEEDTVLPLGLKYDVYEGDATIRSDVSGELKDYKILIKKVFYHDKINKGMIIEVVDESLIHETNGIVQGMSGSPIIQDDKLIGAVTHVFVQDSKKGYGTFIENMLMEEKGVN